MAAGLASFAIMSDKISIRVALAKIDQAILNGKPQQFQIKYRKLDGSLSEIRDAQKGVKHPKGKSDSESGSGRKFNHNIKETGNLILHSQERGGYREVKIDLICEFNGHKVFHV